MGYVKMWGVFGPEGPATTETLLECEIREVEAYPVAASPQNPEGFIVRRGCFREFVEKHKLSETKEGAKARLSELMELARAPIKLHDLLNRVGARPAGYVCQLKDDIAGVMMVSDDTAVSDDGQVAEWRERTWRPVVVTGHVVHRRPEHRQQFQATARELLYSQR